jgi:hypothetical protein
VTEELLQRAYNNRKAHFLQFMRHILGLEKLESFPDAVRRGNLTAEGAEDAEED